MSSISQHISLGQIHNERTSIIYVVTDIVFSLKQHIPPSGELHCLAEVSLFAHLLSSPIGRYCFPADPACDVSLVRWFCGVLALTSGSLSFRTEEGVPSASRLFSFQRPNERKKILSIRRAREPPKIQPGQKISQKNLFNPLQGFL